MKYVKRFQPRSSCNTWGFVDISVNRLILFLLKYRSLLIKTGKNFHTQVERIQNPTLYEQYKIKKKEVQRHMTSNKPVERELFHGTSGVDAQKICVQGFDRGFAGKNGRKLFAR